MEHVTTRTSQGAVGQVNEAAAWQDGAGSDGAKGEEDAADGLLWTMLIRVGSVLHPPDSVGSQQEEAKRELQRKPALELLLTLLQAEGGAGANKAGMVAMPPRLERALSIGSVGDLGDVGGMSLLPGGDVGDGQLVPAGDVGGAAAALARCCPLIAKARPLIVPQLLDVLRVSPAGIGASAADPRLRISAAVVACE